jgi:predicted phage baseplate assembly protein
MSRLAPNLFDRRFGDLMEIGRSKLPSLAPTWTDHNAHDPGITLMELLAWVAEAQIYSLGRSRRDEREAYAALMGIIPGGTRPATGLIWPDHTDPTSPAAMVIRPFVIEPDHGFHTPDSARPEFRPAHRILWIPALIRALTTRRSSGGAIEHSGANRRGGPAFLPFGETAGPRDVLRMELAANGDLPLFPQEIPTGARLVIGIRADAPAGDSTDDIGDWDGVPLEVMLSAGADRFPLTVIEDTSAGFMRSGVIVLDLAEVRIAPMAMVLEFRAPRGFDRAPRILRIEANVVPLTQERRIERELHVVRGLPDEGFDLETPGLSFAPGSDPVIVEIADSGGFDIWRRTTRLTDCGPDDRAYAFDPVAARITFGNGINGRLPNAGGQVLVSYPVCDGNRGNVARNRKWVAEGLAGTFGVNLDPMTGGLDPATSLEQRRKARRLTKTIHPLGSAADIEAAALALPALEVGRAWVAPPSIRAARTGAVTLVAMRSRVGGAESAAVPETQRWLAALRRRLAPRMPLGVRLSVIAPRYAGFTLRCRLEAEPGLDPDAVKTAVANELQRRLTLVAGRPGMLERPFGLAVTHRDLTAWIQALPEVRRVAELQIRVTGSTAEEVAVARRGLPRLDLAGSTIDVIRGSAGGRR